MKYNCSNIFILFVVSLILTGCAGIALYVDDATSDPRGGNTEYFLKYDMTIDMGKYAVHATRYAEVYSLFGKTRSLMGSPRGGGDCNREKEDCWVVNPTFGIPLPNKDIIVASFDTEGLDLSKIIPGERFNLNGSFSVWRDQIGKEAWEKGALLCSPIMNEDMVVKTYGKKSSNMLIEATVTRVEAGSGVTGSSAISKGGYTCEEKYGPVLDQIAIK